jgi:hypothetical protein
MTPRPNRSANPADHVGQGGPVAKPDYARVQIALIRRERFGQDVEVPDLDGPVELFDDDLEALEAAVADHPARGVTNVDTGGRL